MPEALQSGVEYACIATTFVIFIFIFFLAYASPDTRSKLYIFGNGEFYFNKIRAVHITNDARGWGHCLFGLVRLLFGFISVGSTMVRVFVWEDPRGAYPTLEVFVFWNWLGIGVYFIAVGIGSLKSSMVQDGEVADRGGHWIHCLAWVSGQVLFACAVFICLVVWLILLPISMMENGWSDTPSETPAELDTPGTRTLFFNSISWMAHDLAVVFMLVEFYANRMTFVRAHGPFAILFSNCYIVFSWFQYWRTGKFYYAFLDFTRLGYFTPVAYLGLNAGMYGMMTVVAKIGACMKKSVSKDLLPTDEGTPLEQEPFELSAD